MNIEKKTLEKVDVLYDDKKWGKRIDPDEWNANFKTLENAHNQLVDSLTEQVNIVDEAFSNVTTEGGDNIHVDYSGSDFTLQQTLDHIVSDINDRYTKLQSDAVLSENTNPLIRDIFYNSQTGTFTITKKDGSVITIDTVIEKVPASMALKEEADGSVWLVVTNQDGSQTKTNVTSLIEDTVINGSDTINVSSSTDSSNKVTTYTLNIKPNSIGLSHVDSELTAKFEETQNAKNLAVQAKDLAVSAKNEAVTAKNSAIEAKDAAVSAKSDAEKILGLTLSYSSNAKGYAEQASSYKNSAEAAKIAAEKARDEAQSIAGGNYATKSELSTHVNNSDIHVTVEEKAAFSNQSPFIVTLIYGEDDLGKPVYTADKTFDEIESAVSSGKRVYCLDFPTNVIVPYVCRLYKDTDIYCHYFSLFTNRYYRDITISNENVVTFNYSAGNDHLLPSSGLPDSGKVLAVNSQGDPVWTDDLTAHTGNSTVHVTAEERTKWNQAVTDVGNLSEEIVDHENDTTKHITSAERTKWNKNTTDITALNEALANMQGTFVDSVDEMTDTTKKYVLKSTGTVWEYKSATTEQEVTVTDELDDTTYYDNSRFASSATGLTDGFNSQNGYHVTPLIDLNKEEYVGKTIDLHLEGAHYISETNEPYIQNRAYASDGTVLFARSYSNPTDSTYLGAINIKSYTIESNTSAVLTLTPPVTFGAAAIEIGYWRFCGQGAVADSHIYITYKSTQTVTGYQWVDTGVHYGSIGLDEETAAKISELNNEGSDPSTIKLLSAPVLDFYNSDAYPDDDYTVSHLSKITYPCRADVPVPFIAKWSHNENAMRTTLVVDTKAIGTVNPYRMRIYDVTGFDNYPVYNLLPNTTYYYKVTHVLSDGSLVEAKSGSFATSNETFRLLYIEGTQNVRDLGGWTGLNGKKVKYGKIIRGAALSDSTGSNLIVTGKGRLALGELKIQAELNLGAIDNETSIAANCAYKKIGYNNYAGAITGETYRTQFKEVLEWIVSCLDGTLAQTGLFTNVKRNVYMHCQGGCDRTGTLSFQLLGLLGVSESDLAKEYELSSFSDVGFGRLRTTTKAVDTYDYVGMVEAIKAYSGTTITDKFYNFAIDCGISADTITAFRNLMLE